MNRYGSIGCGVSNLRDTKLDTKFQNIQIVSPFYVLIFWEKGEVLQENFYIFCNALIARIEKMKIQISSFNSKFCSFQAYIAFFLKRLEKSLFGKKGLIFVCSALNQFNIKGSLISENFSLWLQSPK